MGDAWLRRGVCGLALIVLTGFTTAPSVGQEPRRPDAYKEAFVNSEVERYMRVLQTLGQVAPYPWSIRGFSAHEIDRLRPHGRHPWVDRYAEEAPAGWLSWELIRPRVQFIHNSNFPYGANDGALWAGRGLTSALEFGVAGRVGPLTYSLAPTAFRAENRTFELMPNGAEGRLAFANARRFSDDRTPLHIDLPQRFGDEPYARLDPGQSTVRLDIVGLAAGLSTANQHWGPASEYPILLGNNAPGFLHGFLGTGRPVNVGLGRFHGRVVWGRLEQSAYSPMGPGRVSRLMTGHVATFTPRGLPGLELGVGRFFHQRWPQGGLTGDDLLKPFEAFLKRRLAAGDPDGDGSDEDNQLASVFARWVFPRSGFEVYGEYGRNDHSWDTRDFVLEPDHNAGYLVGLQKAWRLTGSGLAALRGEVLNTGIGHVHQVRTPQAPFYRHHAMRQGHTHRGQILGAANGYGGGGWLIGGDLYHRGGRFSVTWTRELRQERGNYWWDESLSRLAPDSLDVIHAFGAEALVFRGRWEVTAGLTGAQNLNRDYRSDVFNLNGSLQIRAGW